MATIKARIYGTMDRMGRAVEFEIVDSLPIQGEAVSFGDPGYVWGTAELCRLDPEQRTRDEAELYRYEFYKVPEIDADDGEVTEWHYMAIEAKRSQEPTPRIVQTAVGEVSAYDDEDAYVSDMMMSVIWDEEYVEPSEEWLRQTFKAVRRSVKDILADSGLRQWELCARFLIPRRTVEDWSRGAASCPIYTRLMMQELLGLWSR